MAERTPRVAVIGTGGSISTTGRHSLDLAEYSTFGTTLEVDQVLAHFPEVNRLGIEVVPVRFRRILSTSASPQDWLDLNRKLSEVAAGDPPVDGIAVTHGTATLEETAYFLHLAAKVSIPVVVVGAQRPPNGLSTDAGLNLVNAIRVAAAPAARGLGVLVAMNDEVQSAREVTKTSNWRVQTFRTPDFGILGYADPDGVVDIYRKPVRRHAPDTEFEVREAKDLPKVDIVYSYAGAGGEVVEALVAAGARGIVVAGLPSGNPTPEQRKALIKAAKAGVLVVQSSRSGSGRVADRSRTLEDGFVPADTLNPQKARVLAMLALTVSSERDRVRRMFKEY
ncbi:MAG: asparaginase [Proteobacteria bacterium]|nr:asparaginase [Pseudomonadota bacterium]